jgi:hypothetical protein
MNDPITAPSEKDNLSPEDLYGVYANLEGGKEDTTVRPTRVSLQRFNGKEPLESQSGEKAGGPELIDWLNRTFD